MTYSEVPNKNTVSTINFGLSFHPVIQYAWYVAYSGQYYN